VILFGSRSRGDAREGSDIDVLVVLLNASDYWADFDRVTRAAARTSLRHDLLLSAIPVTEDRLATSGSPFIRNVRREGVRVA
jgi:predicted nucleotidyltransferase